MTDPAQTKILAELFALPAEARDAAWHQRFYAAAPDATLTMFDPQVEIGPDGFPYFQFAIGEADGSPSASVADALNHCLEHGFGIVIFRDATRTDPPGWVFSYGQLMLYAVLGGFDALREPMPEPGEEKRVVEGNRQVLFAAPSDSFLPPVVRKAIADFMRHRLGHSDPRVIMIVDPEEWPSHGLMFNLSVDHFDGDQQRFDAALNALHWFLPQTYCGILKMPPDWEQKSFVSLDED